jgi:hypothetical protein
MIFSSLYYSSRQPLIRGNIQEFAWRNAKKAAKALVKIAGPTFEMKTSEMQIQSVAVIPTC